MRRIAASSATSSSRPNGLGIANLCIPDRSVWRRDLPTCRATTDASGMTEKTRRYRSISRRQALAGGLGLAGSLFAAPALAQGLPPPRAQQTQPRQQQRTAEPTGQPPVVFLHGNGDTGALWMP